VLIQYLANGIVLVQCVNKGTGVPILARRLLCTISASNGYIGFGTQSWLEAQQCIAQALW
jgi:hypothetical protein